MDTKKIIGVMVLVAIVVALGGVIFKQMSQMSGSSADTPAVMVSSTPVKNGLTEAPQLAPTLDTKAPATIDAIVGDISGEASSSQALFDAEASGETSVLDKEESSLNSVSQFYDETNL